LLDTVPATSAWGVFIYVVNASTSSTPLEFFSPITGNDGPHLDAVSVTSATGTPASAALVGVLLGDTVALDTTKGTATFASKNVGNGIAVTVSGLTLGGPQAADYKLVQPPLTANITPQPLTVTAVTNTKAFDGTTSAASVPAITAGAIQGSDAANFTETYDTPAIGTGKTLTPSGTVNDGNGGKNYAYSFAAVNTGVITAAAPPPVISSISPNGGHPDGGGVVQVTGTGFQAGSHVFFGGVPATVTGTPTVTSLSVIVPALPLGSADVKVVNPDGQQSVLAGAYIVTLLSAFPSPVISNVSPSAAGPGSTVQIAGSGFLNGAEVFFGTAQATLTGTQNDTLLSVIVPNLPAGPAAITVVNPDGKTSLPFAGFLVTGPSFGISLPAGNSVVAGNPFLATVQALDAVGNPVTTFTGPANVPITSSPPDAQGSFPITVPLNSSGFGFFQGTLKTAGSYTLTATATGYLQRLSSAITVTPAPANYFSVAAPTSATTGSPLAVTVTAFDAFGNVATGYSGHVHFTSTDSKGALPADATLTAGVGTFSVTLNTAGSQTITATDSVSTNPIIGGTTSPIVTRGLTVTSLTPTATGFTAKFSKPFNPDYLTLYGTGLRTVPDVTLVGAKNGPINGSLIIDPTNTVITFSATHNALLLANDLVSDALPDDTYAVTLVSGSGSNGFLDALGAGLDGTNTAGHANYTTTFTTHYQANATPVLSIPDFARGPDNGHAVKVPNDIGFGIPITLYNAAKVTDASFTLAYNPSLLRGCQITPKQQWHDICARR
jgi:hypothetical protein